MTTSSADVDPDAILQFIEPFSNLNGPRVWPATATAYTPQASAYAASSTTGDDWSSSASSSHYTMTSGSTACAQSSTFSTTPRRAASSISKSSAPSRGTSRGVAMGANPRHDGSYELWCEFRDVEDCNARFRGDDEVGWIQHHITEHLNGTFPSKLVCWFCDEHISFDAGYFHDLQGMFELRMGHIREHIRGDYFGVNSMRPDFHVLEHLHNLGRIDRETFDGLRGYTELPAEYQLPDDYVEPSTYQAARGAQAYCYDQAREDRHRRRQKGSSKRK
ncbi:hypothetical protein OQA88_11348 [Cercophora sp. LCS_1]